MEALKGSYTFDAPQAMVWDALQNPRLLAVIIPTCWGVEKIGDNSFRGTLQFSVGSMSGVFKGNIDLANLQAPNSYDAVVRGSAPIGIVKITGSMNLETLNETQTSMHYNGEVVFGGRIASVGSRLLEMSVKAMLTQSLDALNEHFRVKVKQKSE
jgi:carbon monoxide dehydrogenase subunit G